MRSSRCDAERSPFRFQQVRQLGDIRCYPSCLIVAEQLAGGSSAGFVLGRIWLVELFNPKTAIGTGS
jgi:hypothetical protein